MRPDLAFMDAAVPVTADRAPAIDEDAFRAFYERTARQLWGYLYRRTRDAALADDLLQETYYRMLRAGTAFESDAHQLHYLFRIAANLVTDARRRCRPDDRRLGDHADPVQEASNPARVVEDRRDLERALDTLAPRDRDMLWLAYADGATHAEIAAHLGVARPSIKAMLSRARQRLANRLGLARPAITRRQGER
jgi:RNA polymerase sigma-70 factor (ECF subfamily)